jgi:hypothetical protein
MSGNNPARMQELIMQLNQSESFDCNAVSRCDQILYLLGLTSELLGEEQAAVDIYLKLWKEYPYSFYTIMARSKLVLDPPSVNHGHNLDQFSNVI